jgi:hypothetical protein
MLEKVEANVATLDKDSKENYKKPFTFEETGLVSNRMKGRKP